MGNTTEAVTSAVLKLAMDGAALRHQALASNIANAQTPGYAPLKVSFESELGRARARLAAGENAATVLADAAPEMSEGDTGAGALPVDMQVAELAQNVVQYQALLKGWSKRMAILSAAINEGKR
jgi:flagellar basal-body rod protein FlgB